MVTHTCHQLLRGLRWEDLKFEARLGATYTISKFFKRMEDVAQWWNTSGFSPQY